MSVSLEQVLAEHPFFQGLEPAYRQLIAGCATNVVFQAGVYIFKEGDPSNHFYAIRQGTVALEIFVPGKGALTIQTLTEGDILGWSWLVPPHRKQFSARTDTVTRVLQFDAKCLRTKCDEDPRLGYELLKRITQIVGQRLQATRLQLLDVYGANR